MGRTWNYIRGTVEQFLRWTIFLAIVIGLSLVAYYAWQNWIKMTASSAEKLKASRDAQMERKAGGR